MAPLTTDPGKNERMAPTLTNEQLVTHYGFVCKRMHISKEAVQSERIFRVELLSRLKRAGEAGAYAHR